MTFEPVLVFDSGIGSMSIIKELRKEIPNEDILYFADKANFPYGNKSHKELVVIIENTINYLKRFNPKLIIIASNTPSIQILDEIKERVNIPLLGVTPPLKEAVKLTRNDYIGIMTTASVINSKELTLQIKNDIPQTIFVKKFNASPLISHIESGDFIKKRDKMKGYIRNLLGNLEDIDVIILSSTHLPFIKDQLSEEYPFVKFIDPAKIVAKNVKKVLIEKNLVKKQNLGRMRILVSHGLDEFQELLGFLGIKEKAEEVFWSV
ncbi:MAG: glutamate racemase [Nitrososphaeraceae archaeon]